MKFKYSFLFILFLFLLCNAEAQSNVLEIIDGDLDEYGAVAISDSDQWLFRQGNDFSGSEKIIDESEWQNINPWGLGKRMVKNGILEGWFRIRIKIHENVNDDPLFLTLDNYGQALEFYIDGEYQSGLGKIEKEFQEFRRSNRSDTYVRSILPLEKGKEYLISIHYMHQNLNPVSDLLVRRGNLFFGVQLAPEDFIAKINLEEANYAKFSYAAFAVNITICLLFWLLYFQNPKEKIVLSIVIITTTLSIISLPPIYSMSFSIYIGVDFFQNLNFGILLAGIVYSVALIFSEKAPNWKFIFLPYFFIGMLEFHFIRYGPLGMTIILSSIVFSVYYIIKYRKTIQGSQWAIVIGFIIFIMLVIFMFIAMSMNNSLGIASILFSLLLPITFMVYISTRFQEVLKEVRSKADEVIRITEEKRMQTEKLNIILEESVKERTKELNHSLESLKATQTQLIQSEKMASLGELTAGIAHEIQNPLNFVNNFSEVSKELIQEMREEVKKGDFKEVENISNDLEQNITKIHHHGKRADSIVKGMLMHSRSTKGEKVPTDINALCDEFLRLSYHGMRAKDRSFNVEFKMDLDPDLPELEVVPQDIGRVLLNLFNNAFQACSEAASADRSVSANDDSPTSKLNNEDTSADRSVSATNDNREPRVENRDSSDSQISDDQTSDFHSAVNGKRTSSFAEASADKEETGQRNTEDPKVIVRTKRVVSPLGAGGSGQAIQISVSDNGPGIPDNIKEKIFQPFFTTKPTGQGTGLGLSLAYDIVKAHGGEISLETEEGTGTTFVVRMPIIK